MSVKATVLYRNYPVINQFIESGNSVEVYYDHHYVKTLVAGDAIKLGTRNTVLRGNVQVGSNLLNTKNTILRDYLVIQVESAGEAWDTNPMTSAQATAAGYTWS